MNFYPTPAFVLLHQIIGEPKVASYKAPHAYQPTPKRRKKRLSTVTLPKLFKGHRP